MCNLPFLIWHSSQNSQSAELFEKSSTIVIFPGVGVGKGLGVSVGLGVLVTVGVLVNVGVLVAGIALCVAAIAVCTEISDTSCG
jgi:hypothetical protein